MDRPGLHHRRTLTVPAGWAGRSLQLNFGAVDWQSKVWVNGTLLGIWQTVWLEPTNPAHITRLDTTPNVAAGGLDLVVQAANASGQAVTAQVLTGGSIVGTDAALRFDLESFNYPGYYWRHYAEAVYIATNGGGNAWDATGSYNADATWANSAPLG